MLLIFIGYVTYKLTTMVFVFIFFYINLSNSNNNRLTNTMLSLHYRVIILLPVQFIV